MPKLILGSSSRWRADVLRNASMPFEQMSPDIDEKAIRFDDPILLTLAIAKAKSAALIGKVGRGDWLVTSDQVVWFDRQVREKPADAEEARRWLRGYRLAAVECVTSVVVMQGGSDMFLCGSDTARVHYLDIPDDAIERAITTGTVLGSCGALVRQEPHLAPYVYRIEGTEDSIDGLPLDLTLQLLGVFGYVRPS